MQRCGLEIINIMNNDATLNVAAGAYEGLDRFKARKELWADMKVSHFEEKTVRSWLISWAMQCGCKSAV